MYTNIAGVRVLLDSRLFSIVVPNNFKKDWNVHANTNAQMSNVDMTNNERERIAG